MQKELRIQVNNCNDWIATLKSRRDPSGIGSMFCFYYVPWTAESSCIMHGSLESCIILDRFLTIDRLQFMQSSLVSDMVHWRGKPFSRSIIFKGMCHHHYYKLSTLLRTLTDTPLHVQNNQLANTPRTGRLNLPEHPIIRPHKIES
jgi:hypothetical protein